MRGKWAALIGAGLCSAALASPTVVCAQDPAADAPPAKSPTEPLTPPPAPAAVTPLPPPVEEPPSFPLWQVVTPRLSAGYTSGPGVGFSNGFTQLEAFVPLYGGSPQQLVYLDLRGLISDNNAHWGENAGVGYRYYSPERDRIFGGWSACDIRDTGFNTYTQFSGGVETIGRWLDARANAYVAAGPQSTKTNDYFICAPIFVGTSVLAPHVIDWESALTGMDAEVGGAVPGLARWGIRAFGGGYAYHGEKTATFGGGRARVQARINNNVDLGLQVQADPVFGGTVSFTGALRWGGVRRAFREPDRQSVFNRFADPVQRNYNVAVANTSEQFYQRLTDPTTDAPIVVIHVNNTAAAGGDGSVNHPLNTLAPAPTLAGTYGYILVNKGNGTSSGMNQGVTLLTGQHLLGTTTQWPFISNELGTCKLPIVPLTGAPTITNANGGAVVTLASSNEVAGFNIVPAGGNGILGTGISNFYIHDLAISGATGAGIQLTGVSGTGLVSNVTVTGSTGDGLNVTTTGSSALTLGVTSSTFSSNGGSGINLGSSGSSQLTATVSGGTMNSNTVDGVLATASGSSSLSLTVQNATISVNGTAAVVYSGNTSGTQTATISGNTISSSVNTGTDVSVLQIGAGTLSATVSSNSITIPSNGTGINIQQTPSGSGTTSATVSSNSLSGTTTSSGIQVTQTGNATATGAFSATVSNNTASNLSGGISVTQTANGSSAVTASVTGNTASNNTFNGITIASAASGGGALSVTASTNTTSNNGSAGLSADLSGTGTISGTFSSNTASGNGTNGLLLTTANIGSVTVSSNTTTNNVGAGISLVNTGSYNYTVSSNSLTNDNTGASSNSGGFVTQNSNTLTLTFTSNSSSPFSGFGYFFNNTAGTTTANVTSNGGSNNTGTTGSNVTGGTVTIN